MELDREYIEFRLDVAREEGAKDSQIHLADQLDDGLLQHGFDNGVHLRFDTNRQKFKDTIDMLGFAALIEDKGPMHINQAVVSTLGQSRFAGTAIPALQRLHLTQALEAMQIEYWDTVVAGQGIYAHPELHIPPRSSITSELILAHTLLSGADDEIMGDISKPTVLLRSSSFAGALLLNEYGDSITEEGLDDIPDFIEKSKSTDQKHKIIAEFATYIADEVLGLRMPYSAFSISIGRPIMGRNIIGGIGGVQTKVQVDIL